MDELYELLIHEVHHEGTVNELTGDGLVAFFGAPLAVEQAPQRAVRAALALQQAVTHYSAQVERERLRLQLRVGLNTGPVIVGTVGNNLRMDYKAIGNTVNLAARMEQTAAPGTVQLTEHTYKLVAGYFDCDDMGLVSVKGLAGKVRAYQVRGERGGLARIDVARERGFTRLVGRERNWRCSVTVFALALAGDVARLSRSLATPGWANRACCMSFARRSQVLTAPGSTAAVTLTAQWPISLSLILSSSTSGLTPVTETRTSGASLRRLGQLGMAPEGTAPYLLHWLSRLEGDVLVGPSPEAVKHQTFEALRGLVGEVAARGPLVLAIEDLLG